MYIYIYMSIYICIYIYIYIYMYILYMYIHIYIDIDIYIYMHICQRALWIGFFCKTDPASWCWVGIWIYHVLQCAAMCCSMPKVCCIDVALLQKRHNMFVTYVNISCKLRSMLTQPYHCNTLQHTATYCDALWHTVTQLKRVSLQHTATHYDTLQHTVTHYRTLWYTVTHSEIAP